MTGLAPVPVRDAHPRRTHRAVRRYACAEGPVRTVPLAFPVPASPAGLSGSGKCGDFGLSASAAEAARYSSAQG